MSIALNHAVIILSVQVALVAFLTIMSALSRSSRGAWGWGIAAVLELGSLVAFLLTLIDSCGSVPADQRCVIW